MPKAKISQEQLLNALREIRHERGISSTELAKYLGLASHKSIIDIEFGRRSLSQDELNKLLNLYGYSYEDLVNEILEEPLIKLRALKQTLPSEALEYLNKQENKIELLMDLRRINRRNKSWAKWIKPFYPIPSSQEEAIEQAELLAQSLRNELSLGEDPITNVLELCEQLNIQTLQIPMGKKISGFMMFSNKTGPYIFINSNDSPERRSFSIIHELCHFLVDTHPSAMIWDQPSEAFEPFTDKYNKDYREIRANCFAAALLMPKNGFSNYLTQQLAKGPKTVNQLDIVKLHHRYRVSIPAVLYRLRNLSLITKSNFDKLIQTAKFGAFEIDETLETLEIPKLSWRHLDPEKNLDSALKTTAVDAYLASQISIGKLCEIFDHPVGLQNELLAILKITRPKIPKRIGPNPLLQ